MISLVLDLERAIDDVLVLAGVPIAKADPSPLTRSGFDRLVRALATAMRGEAAGVTRAAVNAAADILDRDWTRLSAEDREKVFARAGQEILTRWVAGATQIAAPVQRHVGGAIAATRQATARAHQLSIPDVFSARDLAASSFAGVSNGFFLRTSGGAIVSGAADRTARGIVAQSIEGAWSRQDTGKEMRKALAGSVARSEQAYLEMVSSVAIARARTFSTLRSFLDAGITSFKIVAVLDEVTSDICRLMHGRTFEVEQVLQRFADVQAAPLGDVAELQPFIRQGRTESGERVLYAQTSAGRTHLATIVRSGVGQIDDVGEFARRASTARVQALGCCSPPFHPHCRTIIVPGATRRTSRPRTGLLTTNATAPALPAARRPRAPPPPPPSSGGRPPTPPKLEAGTHFGRLNSKVSGAQTDEFLQDVALPWVQDALKKFPLGELRLDESQPKSNGWYLSSTRTLAVSMERKSGTWGEPLAPGTPWSISYAGKDKRDATLRTFIHELGHHMQLLDTELTPAAIEVARIVRNAFDDSTVSKISRYSAQNKMEYFAECFAGYVFERPTLRAVDPIGLRMVEAILQVRGIKIP